MTALLPDDYQAVPCADGFDRFATGASFDDGHHHGYGYEMDFGHGCDSWSSPYLNDYMGQPTMQSFEPNGATSTPYGCVPSVSMGYPSLPTSFPSVSMNPEPTHYDYCPEAPQTYFAAYSAPASFLPHNQISFAHSMQSPPAYESWNTSFSAPLPRSTNKPVRKQSSRRAPSGVPSLAFGSLSSASSLSLSTASSLISPTSASFSDIESPRSNRSTPRSASSTPRSASSTPRSFSDKKRSRPGAPHPLERERRVRPKVVAEKGALQCKGLNRKKNSRCRNAALMEYIGPRPLYCAEHITLDPESLYGKCTSAYHKIPGDGKGCREVVLKELSYCHKHYSQGVDVMLDGSEEGLRKAQTHFHRISSLLQQLEAEALAAKRTDPDLFQRKHKLIPKFMDMKKLLLKRFEEFEHGRKSEETCGTSSPPNEHEDYDQAASPKDSSSTTSPTPSEQEQDDIAMHPEDAMGIKSEQHGFPVF